MSERESVIVGAACLPVLRCPDVVVVSGSTRAVATALRCAERGLRVLIVEPRTYLGRDSTATLRPWISVHGQTPSPFWADVLHRVGGDREQGGETALKMDDLKRTLEDMCLEGGVDTLYASQVVDVIVEAGAVTGIAIANKSGRQIVRARAVVDASETGLVGRLACAPPPVEDGPPRYRRVLEFDGLADYPGSTIPVPSELGIVGDVITVHRGYRGTGHAFVEMTLHLPHDEGVEASMAREIAARHVSMELAQHLIQQVAPFGEAMLASSSLELDGPPPASALTVSALWRLSDAMGPDGEEQIVTEICAALNEHAHVEMRRPGRPASRALAVGGAGTAHEPAVTLRELDAPQRGRRYERHDVEACSLPVLAQAEVLVVGGGASGASAAITAAREGVDTVLLEMNGGLGGTGTLAGVHSYWYGRHVAFAAEVQRLTEEVQRPLRHTKATWNIEAKMYALLRAAQNAGARIVFNTIVTGTLVEDGRVRGVMAATPWGPGAVLADVVIDATGDGDVAAFAGAPFVYGSELDHTTMWYSLGQFTTPGRTRNNFTSMVDVSNVEDYTRAILAGRRRGNEVHDHSVYVAPRESRHVIGEVVMSHTDQLVKRQWPDVVNIHYSNHDVKGCSTSPWVRVGLIPPNLEIEVPYRALLPEGLDGILLAGKAISATHDALPAVRMQADMETLGGVVALAAALAVRAGISPREIDVACLQRRLIEEGVLPESVLTRRLDEISRSVEELRRLVDELTGDLPLYDYSDMEMGEIFEGRIPFVDICTSGHRIVPLLEDALSQARGLRRQHLAQALAMYGSPSAVPVLLASIDQYLVEGRLPVRDNKIRHAGYPPDQGAMPDLVYLLYSLGMVRDSRSIEVWERVVDLITGTQEDVRDRRTGTFYYVEAICWSAEHLRDAAAVPVLQRLHARPALHDNVSTSGFQSDFFEERQAMMELMIARALGRCGSDCGVRILVAYLDDARALLAEQAHSHLIAITGRDLGKDAEAWSRELSVKL